MVLVNENQQATGRHLAELRGGMGWTQKQLAERSGVTERSISSFENGDTWPRAGTRAKLEKALGISAGYLSNYAEGPTSSVAESEFTKRFGHLLDGKMPEAQTVINAFSEDLDPDDPDAFGILAERLKGIAAATRAAMEFGELVKSGEESPRDVKYRPVFTDGRFDHVEVVTSSPDTEEDGDGDADRAATPMNDAGGKPATEEAQLASDFVESKRRQRLSRGEVADLSERQRRADETPIEKILGHAADKTGESELQRQDREAERRGEEPQD